MAKLPTLPIFYYLDHFVEMLEFVRPIRLQVEQTNVADVLHQAVTVAESKVPRGEIGVNVEIENPRLSPRYAVRGKRGRQP